MKLGSLFSGYGGLDLAVENVLGAETAWVSDNDKGACKILAHRYPDAPNLGDITTVDWSQVEPVDVITGGSPCQDLSHAGKRGGMTEGTRSNLWVAMREAIAVLRPSLVIWENVRGAYTAGADSEVEPCQGCVGNRPGEPALRALGRVLGDLSDLGYDCGWHGLRAADVGAPHGRFRVFVVAYADGTRLEGRERSQSTHARPTVSSVGALLPTPTSSDTNGAGAHGDGGLDLRTALSLLPTPRATDGTKGGPNQRGSSGDLMLPSAVTLLPTPAVNDMGEGKTVDAWDEWTATMQAKHGNGNGHGKSLSIEAQRLLPTPTSQAAKHGADAQGPELGERRPGEPTDAVRVVSPEAPLAGGSDAEVGSDQDWGVYPDAIRRWESVLGRPAPPPTQLSTKGTPQLAPAFSEFLMGLPAGWVTDVPGITRNEALRALGNGVVPQQAEAALAMLLGVQVAAA